MKKILFILLLLPFLSKAQRPPDMFLQQQRWDSLHLRLTSSSGNYTHQGNGFSYYMQNMGDFRLYGSGSHSGTRLLVTDGALGTIEMGRNGGTTFKASDSLYETGLGQKFDTTVFKIEVVNKNTGAKAFAPWLFAGGSGGGVSNIATGLGLSGGPITSTGTILLDTTYAMTQSTTQLISGGKVFTSQQTLYENNVTGGSLLKFQNDGSNSGTKIATMGLVGSTGAGITGLPNSIFIENQAAGGTSLSSYGGSGLKLMYSTGRTIMQNFTTFGAYFGGSTTASAQVTIAAGTGTAGTSAIKFTAGTLLSSIEAFAKEANANGTYQTSNALNRYAEGGYIADFYTEVNNVGTAETDLYTYTTKANTFAANGEKIIAQYSGIQTGHATANRTYRVYFAGTQIFSSGNYSTGVGASGGDWHIRVTMIRASSSEVRCVVDCNISGIAANSISVSDMGTLTGLTLSGTNILKITGEASSTGAGSDQIRAELGTIAWYGSSAN